MLHGTRPWLTLVLVAACLGVATPGQVEPLQAATGQAGSAPSQTSGVREQDEKVVADLERQWNDAVLRRDADALKSLMADDFLWVSPFKGSWNARRDAHAKGFSDPEGRQKNVTVSHELTDTTVNVTGDTALATSLATITRKGPHWEYQERGRFIHVWQKRGGRWLMVADHWDTEGIVPARVAPAPVDSARLQAYIGKYDAGWPDKLSVTQTPDGLLFQVEMEGGWKETFLPVSTTEFLGKTDPDTRAIFVRDDGGRIAEVIVLFHGRGTRSRKITSGS